MATGSGTGTPASGFVVALCPNVSSDSVREIVDTDLTNAQIDTFLEHAYLMTRSIHGYLGDCGGVSMECAIIVYVAAHLTTIMEPEVTQESVASGEWAVKYAGVWGEGLKGSRYGQMALTFDCSGRLAKLGMKEATMHVTSYYELDDSTYLHTLSGVD